MPDSPSPSTPHGIRDASVEDVETIRTLAARIWRACYPGIISGEQIEYMLGKMYAPEAIWSDLVEKGIRYLVIGGEGGDLLGFAAYGPGEADEAFFLHKLYIDPGWQRCGLGGALIGEIVRRGRAGGKRAIELRVNRGNRPAIDAYLKRGFAIVRELSSDIGGGFAMDDYVMRLRLED